MSLCQLSEGLITGWSVLGKYQLLSAFTGKLSGGKPFFNRINTWLKQDGKTGSIENKRICSDLRILTYSCSMCIIAQFVLSSFGNLGASSVCDETISSTAPNSGFQQVVFIVFFFFLVNCKKYT